MPTPVREHALADLQAQLAGISAIAGLQVARNEDEIDRLPALNQMDADSAERLVEQADGVELWSADVTIEGYVSAASPTALGPDLSALLAEARKAAAATAAASAVVDEVLQGDADATVIREDGVAPHAFFQLLVSLRYGTAAGDPYTQA